MTNTNILFRDVVFSNLHSGAKKPASVSVRLHMMNDDTIYTAKIQSRPEVVGFKDPVTKTIKAESKDKQDEESNNPYVLFRREAIKYAQQKSTELISSLMSKTEEEIQNSGYKPVSRIQKELTEYLTDGVEFVTDLHKQVSMLVTKPLPRINEYVVFADDEIPDNFAVTCKLPYNNPERDTLTDEQISIVNNFLDVFLDDYNKSILSWYFGAALLNYNVYDDKISKMMVVSSSSGGSGKSTLINTLTNALFTTAFSTLSPSFDAYFIAADKFSTSALPVTRMNIYSEADWSDGRDKNCHDFSGLKGSIIKSMITEGQISDEKKFSDFGISRRKSFHTVLTNNPPVINREHEALNRRILPLVVKPTRMIDKARELNLVGRSVFEQFIKENVQAFANYFVKHFLENPYRYTDIEYDYQDYVNDIEISEDEVNETTLAKNNTVKKIQADSGINGIIESIDPMKLRPFKEALQFVVGGGRHDDIRIDGNTIYINSAKKLFVPYDNAGMELRRALDIAYGKPIKKFQKRMFTIPLSEVGIDG